MESIELSYMPLKIENLNISEEDYGLYLIQPSMIKILEESN